MHVTLRPEAAHHHGGTANVTDIRDLRDGRYRVTFEADQDGSYSVFLDGGTTAIGTVGVRTWLSCKPRD